MGLHELAHELACCATIADAQQHDRQVAGDAVAPQSGLPAAVAGDHAAGRAEQRVGVQDAAGEPAVELRVGFGRVELPQHDLALRPGELEHAIGQVAVVVLLDQPDRALARLGDAGHEVDARRLVRAR